VPDGDTGTNMALTLESVSAELNTADSMAEVCHAISRGSLMGARGNSGVITSQIMRGLVEVFRTMERVDGAAVVTGLRRASDAAYQAVMRPVEGTILTVVREAAEAVEADGADDLAGVLERAYDAACGAARRHHRCCRAARRASSTRVARVHAVARAARGGRRAPDPEPSVVITTPAAVTAHLAADGVSNLRYEVMYLLDADDETMPAFRDAWSAIGDSIVVVGGEGLWNCHVHTNNIGAALEAGVDAGRPRNIRVTDLFEEVEEERWVRGRGRRRPDGDPRRRSSRPRSSRSGSARVSAAC
jgi:dihydroxyacetone kinase-like predicted kinase